MAKLENPFRGFLDLRRRELPLALAMFGYFFLVITTFWILKPLKKTAFIGYYQGHGGFDLLGGDPLSGSQAELIAKVMNMVVAFGAALVFGVLARSLKREQLTWVFSLFSALALAAFMLASPGTGADSELGVWLFYLFGDLFNTLMVATFFAFLNDSFAPADARRAYGPIVLGGVIGGAFGALVVRALIDDLSTDAWLGLCVALTALIAALATYAGRQVRVLGEPAAPSPSDGHATAEPKPSLWTGITLVARSRYLLAIVVMVAVYEIVSTTLDFQFTATIESQVAREAQGATFATVFAVTNVFAMVFQLLVTGFILRSVGPRGALLVLPIAVAGAALGFMVVPVVVTAALLSGVDNGLSYSLNQSAREALYTVTSRREKYQAKAFIDMFVQRFAKAIAVGVSLLLTAVAGDLDAIRWLALVPIAGAAIWFLAARFAGREYDRRAHATAATPTPPTPQMEQP